MAMQTLGDNPKPIIVKLPGPVAEAVAKAAAANYESQANYIRRTVIDALRADGLLP